MADPTAAQSTQMFNVLRERFPEPPEPRAVPHACALADPPHYWAGGQERLTPPRRSSCPAERSLRGARPLAWAEGTAHFRQAAAGAGREARGAARERGGIRATAAGPAGYCTRGREARFYLTVSGDRESWQARACTPPQSVERPVTGPEDVRPSTS
ncbi:hypothetical protein AAFF_G00041680 [Aldrovandia affinis]|uniref:Uncharacterized protein n=1 Tax=Aldrovandia affinis TaxID=143900 RepID=A0AAD7WFF0_9TELE|nr:hypothetical protein AAFF_G00041680 [Aldrovandia affinis]